MDTDFNKLPSDIPTIAIVAGRLEINGLPVDDEDLVIEIAKALDINVVKWIGRAAFKQKPGNSAGMRIEFENILTHQQPYAIFNVSTERASNTQYGKKGTSLPPGKFALLPSHHLAKLYTSCGLTFRRMSTAHRDINKLKGRYFTYSAMKGSKIVASMLRHLSLSADDLSPEFLTVLPWRNRPNFVPISNGFTMEKPSQSRPNLVPTKPSSPVTARATDRFSRDTRYTI